MVGEIIISEAVKTTVSEVIDRIIAPKIKQFSERIGLTYEKLLIPKGEHFTEYLNRSYKKHSIVNTLVLRNRQMLLKDIYQPLTLIINRNGHQKDEYKIEGYPKNLLDQYRCLLITDTAGMGKSTIMKRMFLDVIENGYGIPIFIDLRRLSEKKNIIDEIQEQINALSKKFDTQLLLEFLQMGDFIFFFDGFDEIATINLECVISDLKSFVSKVGDCRFVLTSRPESALSCFGEFQQCSIRPLLKKEAYELLRKYDEQGEMSRLLIEKLRTGQFSMIDDFLKNPLLVSLLFAAFDYKQTIPLKKHIFYRQVYDAYFDSHDLSKGDGYIHEKKCKLATDDFNRVLRAIGFLCLKKGTIEYHKDEILQIIEHSKAMCQDLVFDSSDLLDDLLSAVPLFCHDGYYYKWSHKSLQEYFAAQFIYLDTKNNQDAILSALFNSDRVDNYLNILDIYYDIDRFGFNKNILLPLLKDFHQYYVSQYQTVKGITNDSVKERISILYLHSHVVLKYKVEKEPFENVKELLQLANVVHFSSITCLDSNRNRPYIFTYVINGVHKWNKLLALISVKRPDLFMHLPMDLKRKDINLQVGKAYPIVGAHDFSDSQEEYDSINKCMLQVHEHYLLEFLMVSEEIKTIERDIANHERSDSFLLGL